MKEVLREGCSVLSLCDGKASGLEALKRIKNCKINYYAVEISPKKRRIADLNHDKIIRVWDDVLVLADLAEKYLKMDLNCLEDEELQGIFYYDLVLAGPTCTSLSSQGPRTEWEGDSRIFFDCSLILKACKKANPEVKFFFENVASMSNKCRDDISNELGVPHFLGESKWLSAQDRNRYYWFNWDAPDLESMDKGITFNSILDPDGLVGVAFSKSNRNEVGAPAIVEGRIKKIPKANTITTGKGGAGQSTKNYVICKNMKVRDLTVAEGARLQGAENYDFDMFSDTEAWEALGDGWQIDTVVEILRKGLSKPSSVDVL